MHVFEIVDDPLCFWATCFRHGTRYGDNRMQIFVQIHPFPGQQLPQSFESLAEKLGSLPGMFFEMDGSFVWVDHDFTPASQMDGMVYDRQGKLEYVEIKGACNAQQWHTLCQAVCGLAIQRPLEPKSGEAELEYSVIDKIARVHRVAKGDWTTASEIARTLIPL